MRIVIVEDCVEMVDVLKEYFAAYGNTYGLNFEISVFNNAVLFLANYHPCYDLVLMDIKMPYLDGMEAARRLRKIDKEVVLMFVTNMKQFAVKGYEVNAFDYVLKPVSYADFEMKLTDAIKELQDRQEYYLTINTKSGSVRLAVSSVKYISVFQHRLTYYTDGGEYEARGSIKELEKKGYGFLRCDNRYLINPRHITRVGRDTVSIGSTELPISRPRKAKLIADLALYWGRKE